MLQVEAAGRETEKKDKIIMVTEPNAISRNSFVVWLVINIRLTPWSTILLQKLTVVQLVMKHPALMEPEGTNKVLRPFTCPAIKATNVFIY
jgi:hypothetical protein